MPAPRSTGMPGLGRAERLPARPPPRGRVTSGRAAAGRARRRPDGASLRGGHRRARVRVRAPDRARRSSRWTRSSARSTARVTSTAASARPRAGCARAGSTSPRRCAAASRCRRSICCGSARSTSSATAITASRWRGRWDGPTSTPTSPRCVTKVGAERTITLADLPMKSLARVFYERVPLPESRARRDPADRPVGLRAAGRARRGVGLSHQPGPRRVDQPRARRRTSGWRTSTGRSWRCCARPI